MLAQITVRRGSTAEWVAVNPVLASGEFGLDETDQRLKIGNGVDDWASLEFTDAPFARSAELAINAKDHGAVGDGAADDTAALQAALDAAKATKRALYIPQGRYKITASLTYTVTDATKWAGGVVIFGDGMGFAQDGSNSGTTIEPTNAVAGPALDVTGIANADNSNKGQINGLFVHDIGIRGVSGGTNGDGIRVKYFTNCTFLNVAVAYCASGIKFLRQANGATFGYANSISIKNLFAVVNRGWGLEAADAGAMCGLTVEASNFGSNVSGGVKVAPGPSTFMGNIYTGNTGPAVRVVAPTGVSNATGPTFVGDHFESNGGASNPDYSAGSAQVVIDFAQGPRFFGCNFLGGTNGENSVMAGHDGAVTGLTMLGGTHFGKSSVASQAVVVVGPNLLRSRINDTEVTGFGGTAGRAVSSQMFKSTVTDTYTYEHLGQDSVLIGTTSAATGVATAIMSASVIPKLGRATFEISSQGGSIYAYGYVLTDAAGTAVSAVQVAASAGVSLTVSGGSLRITQGSGSTVAFGWSMHVTRTG